MRLRGSLFAPLCVLALALGADTVLGIETAPSADNGALGTRWAEGPVELVVDPSVEAIHAGAFEAVVRAAAAWQQTTPDIPRLLVIRDRATEGYDPNGKNRNVIRFVPEGEPRANGALAITIVTYDEKTRNILDADILLNGLYRFGDAAENTDTYDLESVVVHEIGHVLGLSENLEQEPATMFAYSHPGEINKRDLAGEDIHALTDLYFAPPLKAGCSPASISGTHSGRRGAATFLMLTLGAACIARKHRRLSPSLPIDPIVMKQSSCRNKPVLSQIQLRCQETTVSSCY